MARKKGERKMARKRLERRREKKAKKKAKIVKIGQVDYEISEKIGLNLTFLQQYCHFLYIFMLHYIQVYTRTIHIFGLHLQKYVN